MFKKVIVFIALAGLSAFGLYTIERLGGAKQNDEQIASHSFLSEIAISSNKPNPEQTEPRFEDDNQAVTSSPNEETDQLGNDNYIVDCPITGILEEAEQNKYFSNIQAYFTSLNNAESRDEKLWHALFTHPSANSSRLDKLITYQNRFGNDPIVMLDILRECGINSADPRCTQSMLDKAIKSDQKNGAMWYNLIQVYAAKGEEKALMGAIDELIKSPFFEDGYVRYIQQYLLALKGSQTNTTSLNLLAAFGQAAAITQPSAIATWCIKNSIHLAKGQSCLQFAYYLETQSVTYYDKLIGLQIQERIYEDQGNSEAFKNRVKNRQPLDFILINKASDLMFFDEKLLSTWFTNFEALGEEEAFRLLYQEAINLSKNENYKPC